MLSEGGGCVPTTTIRPPVQEAVQQRETATVEGQETDVQERSRAKGTQKLNVSAPHCQIVLRNTTDNFIAGKTKQYINTWVKITNDRWILSTICGYKIELTHRPRQLTIPSPLSFSDLENSAIQTEIDRFLDCQIIERVTNSATEHEYISNIFTRPKRDGNIRIILNLKQFNTDYMQTILF